MILELMGDERIPYMVFISMLVGFDLLILRRVIQGEKK